MPVGKEMLMSMMMYVLLGYLSGSVLYARLFAKLLGKENIFEMSKDRNPGTSNAFLYGGFWCGVFTLVFDILKGFLPVAFYVAYCGYTNEPLSGLAFVIAAPVIGHIFPIFYEFKGGKGIATTFGCLLGLLPVWQPVAVLAVFFIFFSVILRVTPHFHRTLAAYFGSALCMAFLLDSTAIRAGFLILTLAVCIRMLTSQEEKEKMEVKLFWMH